MSKIGNIKTEALENEGVKKYRYFLVCNSKQNCNISKYNFEIL